MKTARILLAAAAAAAVTLGATQAAAGAPRRAAVYYSCGTGYTRLQDGYGQIQTRSGGQAYVAPAGHGDYFCTQPSQAEGGPWQNFIDHDYYSGYLDLDGAHDTISATTVYYPAYEAWGWANVRGGDEIENYATGKCLGANGVNDNLGMVGCVANGDQQSAGATWTLAS